MNKKRLRVLQVIDDVGQTPARGVKVFYQESITLAQRGAEVHVLTLIERQSIPNWRDYFESERKKYGIHFHPLYIPVLVSFYRSYFLLSRVIYFLKVIFLLKEYNFDIVHEYISAPLLFFKAAVYKKIGSPKVIFTLATYNTGILGSFKFIQGAKWVDRIICLTRHQVNLLIRNGVRRRKVVHLPIGIDINYFDQKFKIKKNRPVVLFLGPIQENKGIFILAESALQVIRKNPDVLFLFVSAFRGCEIKYNQNRVKLKRIIEKSPSNFLLLEGVYSIPEVFSLADIFVFPQTTSSGTIATPVTLLEAMAARKAIVASNTLGVNEVIIDKKSGLLFKNKDKRELTNLILNLLKRKDLRNRLGKTANKRVREGYSLSQEKKRTSQIYIRKFWAETDD